MGNWNHSNLAYEYIRSRSASSDDLKRENAGLRIKLHEMQALVLETALKRKGEQGQGLLIDMTCNKLDSYQGHGRIAGQS